MIFTNNVSKYQITIWIFNKFVSQGLITAQETMSKTPKNHGNPWTNSDVKQLKDLVSHNTPTPLIAYKMGRTPDAVYNKASDEHISLHPTNKSPYGTKK